MDDSIAGKSATEAEPASIGGSVDPGFEAVREAFARNFREQGEVGAGVAVYRHGRKVVDLWGGRADHSGTPYRDDTLQLVFSTTKAVTALCANLLVQRGDLDVDTPVSHYWPEFAAAGKQDMPVRWLLSHKSGLPYVDTALPLDEVLAWDPVVEALAAQAPLWEPGTEHGYHAVTFGWLVGEVIRRISGKSVGQLVADEISGPLGLDLWIGLPAEEQHRVAPLTARGPDGAPGETDLRSLTTVGAGSDLPPEMAAMFEQFFGPESLLMKALAGVKGLANDAGLYNRPDVRAAEIPAANGVSDARSLAKLSAAMIGPVDDVDGNPVGPLLTEEQRDAATTRQTSGPDKVLFIETSFGLGFMLSSPFSPYGAAASFGHTGAGGSVTFADPDNGIGFGYVMNRMLQNLAGDPRTTNLVRALYEAIDVQPAFV